MVIFDGRNYDIWEKAIRTSLKAKNKLGFIEGKQNKSEPNEGEDMIELQAWAIVNSMICSWILNIIEPKLRTSIAYIDTTEQMWQNLKKGYAISNALKIHQLKTKLAKCKQGGVEVVEFYSKLIRLWRELENQVRFPKCTCGKCECGIGDKISKMLKEDKDHQFLVGLNDEIYLNIGGQTLALDPLPSLDKMFNMVHQEEHHKNMTPGRDERTKKLELSR